MHLLSLDAILTCFAVNCITVQSQAWQCIMPILLTEAAASLPIVSIHTEVVDTVVSRHSVFNHVLANLLVMLRLQQAAAKCSKE